MYALGILVSFWAIVAVLLVLRAGGQPCGLGIPVAVAGVSRGAGVVHVLLRAVAGGAVRIGLSLTSVGGELAQKQGYAGSFFTGVLATVVATPCTAPLMGAAIGFALAQPAGVTFAVFTALALGLAAPYVLLSWQPAWARLLPKPGAWMEMLKQVTAADLVRRRRSGWRGCMGSCMRAERWREPGGAAAGVLPAAGGCGLGAGTSGRRSGRARIAAVVLIALGLAIPLSQARGAERAGAVTAERRGGGWVSATEPARRWCGSRTRSRRWMRRGRRGIRCSSTLPRRGA